MIRRYGAALRALLMGTDAAIAIVTAIGVYTLRFLVFPGEPDPGAFGPTWALLALYAGLWVILLYLRGAYRLRAHWTARAELAGIVGATMWLAALSAAALFVLELQTASRLFLLLLFPVLAAVTAATRIGLRWVFMVLRRRGRNARFILVVGTDEAAVRFARQVEEHSVLGLRVTGLLGDHPPDPARGARWPWVGPIERFEQVLNEQIVDEVAIILPAEQGRTIEAIAAISQEAGKLVRIPLAVPALGIGRRVIEDLDGTAVLSIATGPDQLAGLAVKRTIDLVGASLLLVLLSPVWIGVSAWILVRGGRPIVFTQTRVGVHGRPFRMLKFRTMVADAEHRFAEVAPLNQTRGAAFKHTDDPRITPWGRPLRRSSLDELPQLWNVLKGEMSLVGPRPAPPREVESYDLWHRRRLSMKPGLTGLWQVSARHGDDFDERAALDLDYIDRWSLWLDLRIVLQTVPAVFRLEGR